MRNKLKGPSAVVLVLCTTILLGLSRYLLVNGIVGSGLYLSFFTFFDAIMLLTGAVSFGLSSLVFFLRSLFRVALFGISPFIQLYHIPGLCASASWATSNKLIHCGIPLICGILFLAHPVGWSAAPYALYWLIPMAISIFNKDSVFLHSLASTFIAHAVGSILWLYGTSITASMWLNLIPVVIVERLILASAMTLMYWGCVHVGNLIGFSLGARSVREGNV